MTNIQVLIDFRQMPPAVAVSDPTDVLESIVETVLRVAKSHTSRHLRAKGMSSIATDAIAGEFGTEFSPRDIDSDAAATPVFFLASRSAPPLLKA